MGPIRNSTDPARAEFRGDSLIQAYYSALQVYQEMVSPTWDHAFNDRSESMSNFNSGWNRMRFYAFDFYEGIPKPTDIDAITPVFEEGTYAAIFRGVGVWQRCLQMLPPRLTPPR